MSREAMEVPSVNEMEVLELNIKKVAEWWSKGVSTISIANRCNVSRETLEHFIARHGDVFRTPKRVLNDNEIAYMRELRSNGWTYQMIADELGCCRWTAHKYTGDVEVKSPIRPTGPARELERRSKMWNSGMSFTEIAEECCITVPSLRKYMCLHRDKFPYRRKPSTRASQEEIDRILELHEKGLSPSQISKETNRSEGAIWKWIKKYESVG